MENTLTNCEVTVPRIDLTELRTQKHQLIQIPKEVLTDEQYAALDGVIHLLDAIQDIAIARNDFNPKDVFFLSEQED